MISTWSSENCSSVREAGHLFCLQLYCNMSDSSTRDLAYNGMKNSCKCFDVEYVQNLKGIGEFIFKRKLIKDIIKLCKIVGGIKEGLEILVVFLAM